MADTLKPVTPPGGPPAPPTNGSSAASGAAAGADSLRRAALSMPEVLGQSVANMAPTAAMALLPLLVFLNAGNGTWLSFVIAVLLMACVGYCASQFAKRMNSAGSFYVWVTRGFGPGAGHAAGWGLQLGYIATGMATVLGFGIFAGDFLTRLGLPGTNPIVQTVLYAVDFILPVSVAIADMRLSARTALTLEGISIAIILFLCAAIFVVHGGPIDTQQFSFKGVVPGGVLVGVVLAIFAFVGFESAGSLGMEARNPYRNIGRAILWSSIVVGLFYVVVSYSQVLGFQGTKPGFAKSVAPLPDLANVVGIGFLAYIIDIGIMCSMFACTLACINAAARIAFTMAHDGMGAKALAQIHPVRKTPVVGIWTVAVPMFVVPAALVLLGRNPVDVTGWAGTVATFGFMLAYALVSLAAPYFLSRIKESSLIVTVLGLVGAIAMVVVFYSNWLPQTIPGGLFPTLTSPYNILPYIFFAWTAIGIIWYLVVKQRDPEAAKLMGTRYESVGSETR